MKKSDVFAFENQPYNTAYTLLTSRTIRAYDKKAILEYFNILDKNLESKIISKVLENPLSENEIDGFGRKLSSINIYDFIEETRIATRNPNYFAFPNKVADKIFQEIANKNKAILNVKIQDLPN